MAAQLYFPLAGKFLFSVVSPWFQQIRSPPSKWVEMRPRSPCTHSIPTKCTRFGSQPAPVWDMGPLPSGPSIGLLTETTRHMVGGWGVPGVWDRVWGTLGIFRDICFPLGITAVGFGQTKVLTFTLLLSIPSTSHCLPGQRDFAPSMCSCESS